MKPHTPATTPERWNSAIEAIQNGIESVLDSLPGFPLTDRHAIVHIAVELWLAAFSRELPLAQVAQGIVDGYIESFADEGECQELVGNIGNPSRLAVAGLIQAMVKCLARISD